MKRILALLTTLVIVVASLVTLTLVTSAANDYYVYSAEQLKAIETTGNITVKEVISDDGTVLLHYINDGKSKNAHATFTFFEDAANAPFNPDEYPYVAVSAKSNILASGGRLSANLGFKIKTTGNYERCWGFTSLDKNFGSTEIDTFGKLTKHVFDMRKFRNYSGGTATYEDVDIEAGLKYFRLVPWANATDLTAGEYFDVEYVGFFKTEDEARAYTHKQSGEIYTVTFKDHEGKTVKTAKVVGGYDVAFPTVAAEIGDGLDFLGFKDESGVLHKSLYKANSNAVLTATYSDPVDLNDSYIFTAEKLDPLKKARGNMGVLMEENGEKFIRISAGGSVGTEGYVNFYFHSDDDTASNNPEFEVKDYPFMVLGYRSDVAVSSPEFPINAGLKIAGTGKYERCTGISGKTINNDTFKTEIFDLASFRGDYTMSDVADGTGLSYIRIYPWYKSANTLRNADKEHFDVKYIAFFPTLDAAKEFVGDETVDPMYKILFKDRDGLRVSLLEVYEGTTVIIPRGPSAEGKTFKCWVDENGNEYTANFKATGNLTLKAFYEGDKIEVYTPDTATMHGFTAKQAKEKGLIYASPKGVLSVDEDYVEYNGNKLVRLSTPANGGTYDRFTYVTFNLEDEFRAHEYPYLAIGYKTDIVTTAKWALSFGMMNDGVYTRFFGLYPKYVGGDEFTKMVVDIRTVTGSDAGANWTGVDKESDIEYVRLTPWGNSFNIPVEGNQHLDILYMAFFKTEAEANAYVYNEEDFALKADRVDTPFIAGYDGFEFRPENNMTRAEACTVVTRLLVDETTLDNSKSTAFTDLNKNAWYYKYITYLEGLGYLKSYSGEFKPDQKITRAEFVELVYNMGKISGGNNNVSFKDVPETHPRYKVIMAAAKAGIVNGRTKDTFDPDGNIKRSEVVKVLCIALGRLPSLAGMQDVTFGGFSDITSAHWAYPYVIEAAYEHEAYIGDDGNEVWISATDNNFYMKKAPETLVSTLDAEFNKRKNEILNSASEWTVKQGGTVWYVSNSGLDTNDGKSESTPFATLEKVSALQKDGTIKSGDVVLLKRGDEWHVKFSTKNGVTYSAYGTGAKPRVLGSIEADRADQWVKTNYPNVYKYAEPIYMAQDVGQIVFDDGKAYGFKTVKKIGENIALSGGDEGYVSNGIDYWYFNEQAFTNEKDLKHHLQFYHNYDDSTLYLYCEGGNPADLFDSIEIATKGDTVTGVSNVIIDNWNIRYTGSHGINTNSIENFTVRNCEVGWIGGSHSSPGQSTTRYGNAIQVYGMATGYFVYNNYVHNCFDCGPTIQVGVTLTEGKKVVFENVEIRDNVCWDGDLEVWLTTDIPNTATTYGKLINCNLTGNLVTASGYGWSGYNHQKHEYCSFYGAGDTFAEFINCGIENNKFWNIRKNLIKATATSTVNNLGFAWKDNTIVMIYDGQFGQLGKNTKLADGGLSLYMYNNATIKQLLGNNAFGFNDFYYTLAPGQADPAK